MKKVWYYTHDPMLTMFYPEKEAVEMFGEYDPDPWGNSWTELPDDLHDRFIEAKKQFYLAVDELEKYLKDNHK